MRPWAPRLRRWLANLGAIRSVAVLAYGVGVWLRWVYTLELHHPRHSIFGDGMPITELAQILVDPSATQACFHTVWPPYASAYLALNLVFDPTLGSAAVGLFVLSIATPPLIAHAGRLAYGSRVGWIALAVASLDLIFVHYGAYFLFEAPFLFAVSLALWASVAALVLAAGPAAQGASRATEMRWRIVAAVGSGAAWGLAFGFRSNGLPVALFAGLVLGVQSAWRKRWGALAGLGAGALGLLIVAAPIADRCTVLTGHTCAGANNFAMNVALGHAPDVAGLHFVPGPGECSGGMNYWFPPSRVRRGYHGTGEVPGSIYDGRRILSWVRDRFTASPTEFVVVAIGNSLDLLSTDYWPDDVAKISTHEATVFAQVFLVAVLVPGLAMGWLTIRRSVKRRPVADAEVLLVAIVLAIFLVSATSLGEARYRVPFDGAFILLACRAWAGENAAPEKASTARHPRALRLAVAAVCAGVLVAAGLLGGAAHPGVRLAAWLAARVHPRDSTRAPRETRLLAEFASRRLDGSPWDAQGNVRFGCSPDCTPITIDLDGVRHDSSIDISTDGNDRYEAVFGRAGVPVGRLAWGVFEGPMGMRGQRLDVPASAVQSGYDALTIRPLYGDGRYSMGHVLLSEP
jgi:hypothetical protein